MHLKCNTLIVLCWTKCSVFRAYLDGPLSEITKRGPGFLAFLENNFLLLLVEIFFPLFFVSFVAAFSKTSVTFTSTLVFLSPVRLQS